MKLGFATLAKPKNAGQAHLIWKFLTAKPLRPQRCAKKINKWRNKTAQSSVVRHLDPQLVHGI
jgi:hypothetical protein